MQEAWFGRGQLIDVMHSSVDAFGHDVVLECGHVLRHVQLKSRALSGKNTRYKINTRLAERPSGCVVWIGWARRPGLNQVDMLALGFGAGAGDGEVVPDAVLPFAVGSTDRGAAVDGG